MRAQEQGSAGSALRGPARHVSPGRVAAAVVATVLVGATGSQVAVSSASFVDRAANGPNGWVASTLAPPTGLSVVRTCVADPVPAFRSASAAATGSGSVTIAVPAGTVAGDVMVAGIGWEGAGPVPAPPGWSKVREDGLPAVTQAAFVRVATGSEPPSYTWTHTNGNAAGGILTYSGVDPASPVNASSGQADDLSKTAIAPSVTTTRANVRLVGLFTTFGVQEQLSVEARMTRRWAVWSTGTGSTATQVSAAGAGEAWEAPGATGTRRATTVGGSKSVGELVALQPPLRPYATSTWTPSTSSYATGQEFRRSSGGTVQRTAALSGSVAAQSDGPLTPGTAYTFDVRATAPGTWRSTLATAAFTPQSC